MHLCTIDNNVTVPGRASPVTRRFPLMLKDPASTSAIRAGYRTRLETVVVLLCESATILRQPLTDKMFSIHTYSESYAFREAASFVTPKELPCTNPDK